MGILSRSYAETMNGLYNALSSNNPIKQLSYSKSRSEVKKDYKRRTEQPRNAPCQCGSGKKFKRCCGKIINE